MRYRYIVTCEADDDFETEDLRIDLSELVNEYDTWNIKVTCEDEYCIKRNDKKLGEQE